MYTINILLDYNQPAFDYVDKVLDRAAHHIP